jgi:hypothetical protein
MIQEMICFILQPSYEEETSARVLQDDPIDRNLNIVINQSQGKVEKNRQFLEDRKEDREGSPQRKVDKSENEDQFPMAGYPLHSTPTRIDEKQFSGEIPR